MTLAQALAEAASQGLARVDAQLLLLHALGRPSHDRAWLLAHDTDFLRPEASVAFKTACERRRDGEPVAYILGHKEFHGVDLTVDRRVLVPRPDTETLVDWALELAPSDGAGSKPWRVIDLGTGSGAIALALKRAFPSAVVEAVDASAPALEVARENADRLGLEVTFRQADWLQDAGHYHLIASNPPYIRVDDPHLAALRHEPASALVAGADGLADIRRIVADAPRHLQPGGWVLLEHGYDQAGAVCALLVEAGFTQVQSRRDIGGIERVSGGRRLELG